MGSFTTICPRDDAEARRASDWCADLRARLEAGGHWSAHIVDDRTPADRPAVELGLQTPVDLVLYFGHGATDAWLTDGAKTLDPSNVGTVAPQALVSIACLTGRDLGPEAVRAGATAWLGFTIMVPVVDPHKNVDPIGEAIVQGLAEFGRGACFADVCLALQTAFDALSRRCQGATGVYGGHPGRWLSYYGALALRQSTTVEGAGDHRPFP
jgi:hypothetical protein